MPSHSSVHTVLGNELQGKEKGSLRFNVLSTMINTDRFLGKDGDGNWLCPFKGTTPAFARSDLGKSQKT